MGISINKFSINNIEAIKLSTGSYIILDQFGRRLGYADDRRSAIWFILTYIIKYLK